MSLGYSVSTALGRVAAGEVDSIWTPRTPRNGTCGVVLVHGSGYPHEFVDSTPQPSSVRLAAALSTAGIPCIAGDFGGQTWGNDTSQSRIAAAWAALRGLFPSMRSDKVCLLGVSMGGAAVARYSQVNPTQVAAIVGLIPLLNLTAFYAANVGVAVGTEIGNAWGVVAPAALPSGASIAANVAAAATVPLLCGYSTVDTIVLPGWVTSYVTAINAAGGTATAQVTDSTYGHSDQAVGGMPIPMVGQFFTANGA